MQTQYHILIIDDEVKICRLLREILQKEGYAVDYCTNGYDGLDCFKRQPFDLLILDLHMPGMSGFDLINKMKITKNVVPVIVLTGWSLKTDDYQRLQERVQVIMDKPVDLVHLTSTVYRLLH